MACLPYQAKVSLFLGGILLEIIGSFCSLESRLFFDSVCSIRIHSRNRDNFEKPLFPNHIIQSHRRMMHHEAVSRITDSCTALDEKIALIDKATEKGKDRKNQIISYSGSAYFITGLVIAVRVI